MRKTKIIILIITIFFFSINFVFWNSCSYQKEIDKCLDANKNSTTKSIEDFVCIVWSYEKIVYQVVLDGEFKEIDDEMDNYIYDLEKEKNRYFWKKKIKNFVWWLNDLSEKKEYFRNKYKDSCWINIISKVVSCSDSNSTSNDNAKDFFKESDCMSLANQKLEIFDNITYSILLMNKQQVKADDKKKYDQLQRQDYNRVLDLMMVNIWYIERIWQKTISFIAKPYK